MLTKPWCGWAHMTAFGTDVGPVSDIEDVPVTLLNAFISYFKERVTGNRRRPFPSLSFDTEGYTVGILEFDDRLFAADTKSGTPPYLNLREIKDNADALTSPEEYLTVLGKELVSDIGESLDAWTRWGYEPMSDEEYKNRKILLLRKCSTLTEMVEAFQGCHD